jgi:hypothetical protein
MKYITVTIFLNFILILILIENKLWRLECLCSWTKHTLLGPIDTASFSPKFYPRKEADSSLQNTVYN